MGKEGPFGEAGCTGSRFNPRNPLRFHSGATDPAFFLQCEDHSFLDNPSYRCSRSAACRSAGVSMTTCSCSPKYLGRTKVSLWAYGISGAMRCGGAPPPVPLRPLSPFVRAT